MQIIYKFVHRTKLLTLLCVALYMKRSGGRDLPAGQRDISLGKDSLLWSKLKTFSSTAKNISKRSSPPPTTLQTGFQAIASAYGDYTKKSFEDTKSFVEKLSGVKSLDKAIEAQTEFAKSAYETFVAESQKIAGLYSDLAKQTFKPLEGMVAKVHPGRP